MMFNLFNLWPKRSYKKPYIKYDFKTINPNEELFNTLMHKGCPDCGNKEFLEGPSGGMCTNIECSNTKCKSRFNILPMNWAERIYSR